MDKSVLVIDEPKTCGSCPLLSASDECIVQDDDTNFNADSFDTLRATCPLKKFPKQISPDSADYAHEASYIKGWNDCLEKIAPVQEEKE